MVLALFSSIFVSLSQASDVLGVLELSQYLAPKLAQYRYMEKNCRAPTDEESESFSDWKTYPVGDQELEWPGFSDIKICTYTLSETLEGEKVSKTAQVALLNPSADQLARWIHTACTQVNGSYTKECGNFLADETIGASGAQFPVAGIVLENLEGNFIGKYVFRNGVAVWLDGRRNGKDPLPPSEQELKDSFDPDLISLPTTKVKLYARIQSTSSKEYYRYGSDPRRLSKLFTSKDGTLETTPLWLEIIRKSYQMAWTSDEYELMTVKAKAYREYGQLPR
jgi:hypothetical protein